MKIKRWHVVVLALFVLLCGALFYHFYTERISNEALQAVDFHVRPDSTCYIWLNGSENDADTPVSVATGYLNIRKSSPDAENKWMLRVVLWQEGGARVRMDVDAKTRWECVKLMNQRIVTLFTEFRIP